VTGNLEEEEEEEEEISRSCEFDRQRQTDMPAESDLNWTRRDWGIDWESEAMRSSVEGIVEGV
jgi:hypothetical protein